MDIDALRLAAAAFKSALQGDDRQAVVAAARRLVELDAPLGQQWPGLVQEVFRWGELNLALSALNAWHRQGAPAHAVNHEKAALLARAGLAERAANLADALPADFPSPVANAYLRAALAVSQGRREAGARFFRRAVQLRPDSGRSWLGLAQLGEVSERDREKMLALATEGRFEDEEDRAALENALGLIEHRKGNHLAAFEHFEKSTSIVGRQRPYSKSDNEESARTAASWSRSNLANLDQREGGQGRSPILVTGLARSGTTLVQEILASHSCVKGGAELGLAMQIEAMVGGFAPADIAAYQAAGGRLSELRETYLRLVAERLPGEGAFVDKSLNLSRSLGPFALLFPESPIIWLRRDPLDNAWSIFRTWLSRSAVSGWSLEDIGHHMKLEDVLFEHWTRELGDRILVVPYADLVKQPEHWIERITEHCGLRFEPRQMDFHLARRSINTASMLQVRTPINRDGLHSAQPFSRLMQPFIDAYGG
ncbi:MAG: sulfotransferase [Croceibacterium sp.]